MQPPHQNLNHPSSVYPNQQMQQTQNTFANQGAPNSQINAFTQQQMQQQSKTFSMISNPFSLSHFFPGYNNKNIPRGQEAAFNNPGNDHIGYNLRPNYQNSGGNNNLNSLNQSQDEKTQINNNKFIQPPPGMNNVKKYTNN